MTDQERKAMQMALEALESAANNEGNFHDYKYAANALRQALAQPEQEPVAWLEYDDEGYLFLSGKRKGAFPVFTAPPSKPWQSLTDEELNDVAEESEFGYTNLARAIEAKLKELNHV